MFCVGVLRVILRFPVFCPGNRNRNRWPRICCTSSSGHRRILLSTNLRAMAIAPLESSCGVGRSRTDTESEFEWCSGHARRDMYYIDYTARYSLRTWRLGWVECIYLISWLPFASATSWTVGLSGLLLCFYYNLLISYGRATINLQYKWWAVVLFTSWCNGNKYHLIRFLSSHFYQVILWSNFLQERQCEHDKCSMVVSSIGCLMLL